MRPLSLIIRVLVLVVCVAVVHEPYSLTAPQAVMRGDAAYRSRQYGQALAEYRAALISQPGNSLIVGKIADSALAAHRADLAVLFLFQQASLNGWTPALHRKMADALDAQGDRLQAVPHWRASLIGAKDDIPTLRKLVSGALNSRDWDGAVGMLSQLIIIDPNDHHALYQAGLLLAPTDAVTALGYLQRAYADPQYRTTVAPVINTINVNQASPATLAFQVGLTLMSARAWPYAERALTVALDKGSNVPAVLAFLGVVQDQQGRDGWPLLDKAYASAPNDPLVNYAVALHWRLVGDSNKALDALSRSYTLDPRNPAIAAEIGLVYQKDGRLKEAAEWLTLATTLAPNNAGFRTLLATFYADTGYNMSGEGLGTLRRLAEQSPNDADIRASLGWALLSTGQPDAARVELERAMTLDPTNTRARYYFGIFLENRGDRKGAIDAYLYVYAANPGSGFRDLAAGALKRLGYAVDPGEVP